MSDGALARARGALYGVQTDRRRRWLATVAGALLGVGLATLHWGGLVVGGAAVGLTWPTLRRALVAGAAFGVVVVALFLARLALAGSLDEAVATGLLFGVAVVAPLAGGLLGASVRGLFADHSGKSG